MNGTSLCPKCGTDYVLKMRYGFLSGMQPRWAADSASLVDRDVAMVIGFKQFRFCKTVIRSQSQRFESQGDRLRWLKSTKVKNIRLVAGDHDIDYKISALGRWG